MPTRRRKSGAGGASASGADTGPARDRHRRPAPLPAARVSDACGSAPAPESFPGRQSPPLSERSLLQAAFDALPVQVALIDPAGAIVLANRAWQQLAQDGWPQPIQVIDENTLSVYCEAAGRETAVASELAQAIRRALAGEIPAFYRSYGCEGLDQTRWCRWRVWPTPFGDKRGAVLIHEDVTEQNLAPAAVRAPKPKQDESSESRDADCRLQAGEARFRLFARATQDVMYDLDLVADTMWCNDRHFELFGETDRPPYQWWVAHLHPGDRQRVTESLQQALQGDRDYWAEDYRISRPNGQYAYVMDRGFIVRDSSGRAVRLIGAATDITARKRAENALRESEEKFRLAFEEGPLGMALLGTDGVFLEVNPCFARMLGYTTEELREKSIQEITHQDDRAATLALAKQALSGEIPGYTLDKRYLRKDGQVVWARLTSATVRDRQGRRLYGLGMVEDVTERKRAEEALRRAERLASIGTLAAGLAHEINNPLGAIVLSAEAAMLAKDQSDREEILVASLNNIQTAALRCGRIVRSVLHFTRDEVSHKWPGDLADVARHARDVTRRIAAEADCAVRLEIGDGLPPLVFNPTEMEQVFVNLICNAIQASKRGSEVLVRIESWDDAVRVVVEDHGRGMTPDELRHVFDPFYTTRRDKGGTGLGLSITYGIIHQHGGTIDVQSQSGRGTTVEIILPAAASTGEAAE